MRLSSCSGSSGYTVNRTDDWFWQSAHFYYDGIVMFFNDFIKINVFYIARFS